MPDLMPLRFAAIVAESVAAIVFFAFSKSYHNDMQTFTILSKKETGLFIFDGVSSVKQP